jgi:type I restriction enzyme, S subunit
MGSEWQSLTVDQIKAGNGRSIAIGPFGSRMKADTYVSLGVPVIRGNNISDTKAFTGEFVHVSEKTADELRACNVFPGDLVFPHRGAIGQVGIVTESEHPRFMLSTSLMKLTCRSELVEPLFVFYFFRSAAGRNALLEHSSTVGTPGIGQPLASLRSIRVPVPSLSEQRAIAHILGSLDDKIELNRKQNETLEAMARALFKAWFVDFEPVRAKMEGRWRRGQSLPGLPAHLYDVFPDRIVESELGEIPEGWEHIPFGSLLESTTGGDWGTDIPENDHTEVVSIIRGADFPDVSSGGIGKVPTRYTTEKKLVSRRLQAGDIILEISGGSPTQPTGRSIFISEATLERFENAVVCASFCRRFQPKNRDLGALAYMHLQNLYAAGGTWEYQNQSTGIANFQTTRFLESEMVVMPSAKLLDAFSVQANSMLKRMSSNENIMLAKLRDTLLPKLISGELRVPDAERIIGAAA